MKKTIIQLVAFLAVSLLLGYGMVRIDRRLRAPSDTPPQADTTIVLDTLTSPGSEPVSAIPDGFELVPAGTATKIALYEDMVSQLSHDLYEKEHPAPALVEIHDTTYIVVPMQDYTFTDHKTYEYAVRGYGVTELWHKSFQETTTITQHVPEYRPYSWTLWPKVGAIAGKGFLGVQAGIGADIAISQNRRWRFEPEAGYMMLNTGGQLSQGFYGSAVIKFNLIQVK